MDSVRLLHGYLAPRAGLKTDSMPSGHKSTSIVVFSFTISTASSVDTLLAVLFIALLEIVLSATPLPFFPLVAC
jgi:hypothetical protein